jgi:hypothetical protein
MKQPLSVMANDNDEVNFCEVQSSE